MLIDTLRISAFRGIKTELQLDLGARLTVLYAPNGTGKTSVCDAIEWALSGEVHRLSAALRSSPTDGVRNLFAENRDTFVEADLGFDDGPLKVRQIGVGFNIRLEQGTPLWRNLDRNQLLQRLAPSNLPPGATRRQNRNRITWFRAVRLLEALDLEILLDDTEKAQDVRGLLFSNLFGIGELQGREQELEGVLGKMKPPRRIESEASELRNQIQAIELELNSAGDSASAPFWEAARKHLANAAKYLVVPLESGASPEQLASVLESVRSSADLRAECIRKALEKITREWDRFQALPQEIAKIETALAIEMTKVADLRQQHEDAVAARLRFVAAIEESVRRERQLRNLNSDSLTSQLNDGLARWRETGGDLNDPLDIQTLRAAENVAQTQMERSEQQRVAFDLSDQNIPQWLELARVLKAGEARMSQLEIPAAETVAANERALRSAKDELRRIDAESSRLAAPLERLKSEGWRLLEQMPDEHSCPLCAHQYESASQLREAINASLQALPAALSIFAAQKTNQEEIAAEAMQRKTRGEAIVAEVAQLNQTMADARQKLQTVANTLRGTGADLPDLSDPSFFSRFQAAQAEFQRRIDLELQQRAVSQARRTAAEQLLEVRDAILAAAESLRLLAIGESAEMALASLPPAKWSAALAHLSAQLAGALQQAGEKIHVTRESAEPVQQKIHTLSIQIAETVAKVSAQTGQLGELRSGLLRLQEEWSVAAGDSLPTGETLSALPKRLADLTERSGRAAIELRSALDTIAKAQDATARERQAVANRTKLAQLREGLRRLAQIEERRRELDSAVSLLREAKEAFVKQQIQPLCKVITALYRRAQSNSFITEIGTDKDSETHKWTALVEGLRLESIAQLSQGQRQDLALAIFLARARDLRGTFILDEPLQHLDDLNRVALLDVFRVLVTEHADQPIRFIITTSSNALVRHFREKFSLLNSNEHGPALRIYRLSGNPQAGVSAIEE